MKNNVSSWPFFDHEQIKAVSKILDSGNVNYLNGNEGKLFEKEFAKSTNSKYAIALANGSLALSAAYKALGVGKDSEIITTPRTFIATTSCAILAGAKPVFADVNEDPGLITAKTIEPLITKKTSLISVVHLAGWPADMPEICKLAKRYNLKVVEDCSQAHGAKLKINNEWKSVGSFGEVGTWSFCTDKIISTGGEGGMITTNSVDLWDKIWSIKDHGKTLESISRKDHPIGYRWVHDRIGTNFRLTEMQSAIGRVQLKNLSEMNNLRARNALFLRDELENISYLKLPYPPKDTIHAWYKFYLYINPKALKSEWSRDRIIKEISTMGYPCYSGGCGEIYLEKGIKELGYCPQNRLPNAKKLADTSLMFCVHPTITPEEMQKYANVIKKILLMASN